MAECAVEKHQRGFARRFDFADIRLNNHALRIIRHIHVQCLRTNFDHTFATLPECRLDNCFRPALLFQNIGQFVFVRGNEHAGNYLRAARRQIAQISLFHIPSHQFGRIDKTLPRLPGMLQPLAEGFGFGGIIPCAQRQQKRRGRMVLPRVKYGFHTHGFQMRGQCFQVVRRFGIGLAGNECQNGLLGHGRISLLKPKLYSEIKPKDFSDGLIHETDSDKMVSPFSVGTCS